MEGIDYLLIGLPVTYPINYLLNQSLEQFLR
jgi:hypothetical protein